MAESSSGSGNWWDGWIQAAKEKSAQTIEQIRHDLNEFSTVCTQDASAMVTSTSEKLQGSLLSDGDSASNSSTAYVRKGLTSFLGGISKALTIPPDDDEDDDLLRVTSAGSFEVFDKAKVRLYEIQTSPQTYCTEPDGDIDKFNDWKTTFDLDARKGEISDLLVSVNEVRSIYTKLVPSAVTHSDFWERYFYKVKQLEEDERRKTDLKKRADKLKGDNSDQAWEDDWETDDSALQTLTAGAAATAVNSSDASSVPLLVPSSEPSQTVPPPELVLVPSSEPSQTVPPPELVLVPSSEPSQTVPPPELVLVPSSEPSQTVPHTNTVKHVDEEHDELTNPLAVQVVETTREPAPHEDVAPHTTQEPAPHEDVAPHSAHTLANNSIPSATEPETQSATEPEAQSATEPDAPSATEPVVSSGTETGGLSDVPHFRTTDSEVSCVQTIVHVQREVADPSKSETIIPEYENVEHRPVKEIPTPSAIPEKCLEEKKEITTKPAEHVAMTPSAASKPSIESPLAKDQAESVVVDSAAAKSEPGVKEGGHADDPVKEVLVKEKGGYVMVGSERPTPTSSIGSTDAKESESGLDDEWDKELFGEDLKAVQELAEQIGSGKTDVNIDVDDDDDWENWE